MSSDFTYSHQALAVRENLLEKSGHCTRHADMIGVYNGAIHKQECATLCNKDLLSINSTTNRTAFIGQYFR